MTLLLSWVKKKGKVDRKKARQKERTSAVDVDERSCEDGCCKDSTGAQPWWINPRETIIETVQPPNTGRKKKTAWYLYKPPLVSIFYFYYTYILIQLKYVAVVWGALPTPQKILNFLPTLDLFSDLCAPPGFVRYLGQGCRSFSPPCTYRKRHKV